MLPILKSEFRKLFTVRSTYIMIALSMALIILVNFFFEGYKGNTGSPASGVTPGALQSIVSTGAGLGVIFATIVAILFMAHEYRYNTIMYTLTANVRRSKVLLAKVLTIIIFSLMYSTLACLLAVGSYMAGLSLRDATLPTQNFDVLVQVSRVAFYYMSYALIGLLLAILTRSVVFAVSTFLIVPVTVEPLLGLLLKENAKYLPFTALDSTVGVSMTTDKLLSPTNAMAVASVYLVVGCLIAWLFFMRRDAN